MAPLFFGLFVLASPAAAQCRLALALALDISSSVDQVEDRLQREGLAAALTSDDVVEAFLAVPGQEVTLAVFEWSGRYQQDVILSWRKMASRSDIFAAAQRIAGSKRNYTEFPTAIGYALGFAAGLFEDAPPCLFQTLDVSGDGRNNEGFGPALAYANFPLGEVTVNGLVIGQGDDDLMGYYEREVIKGPGAFVEEARDFQDFERAMRQKLLRELMVRAVGALHGAGARGG
ncbi:DUF1194 domain-containing protein [Pseudoruegeria sp. HB172150]|uniref:DUF1194 domain-containing protein n=1 Tax=Pseudoruegeria sp. HB172150 TaxID=2721164 RepID=UPI0020A670F6|nr:DUF1194 domain-containing protein [Pseudoruegeria sp. HB172150]